MRSFLILVLFAIPFYSFSGDILYLHTDRQSYLAGETIFFKAYILSESASTNSGTNLILELTNDSGRTIQSYQFPVFTSTSVGSIDLPKSTKQGVYFLNARTNCVAEKRSIKILYVFNSQSPLSHFSSRFDLTYKILPNKIIADIDNTMFLQFFGQHGEPIGITGILMNSAGEKVLDFKTSSVGVGKFNFTPKAEEKYILSVILPNGKKETVAIPRTEKNGAVMAISNTEKGKMLNIEVSDQSAQSMRVIGMMEKDVLFDQAISISKGKYKTLIPTKQIPSGLMRILLLNSEGKVLSNICTLIVNPETFLSCKMNIAPTSSDGKSVLSLQFPDSTIGSFSISVTDYDEEPHVKQQNIYSSFLSDSESPPLSLGSMSDLTKISVIENELLDLLNSFNKPVSIVTTNGLNKESRGCATDTNYIRISGKALDIRSNKPLSKGNLEFLFIGKDSSSSVLSSQIAKDGSFKLKNLVYYDTATFKYNLEGSKTDEVKIELDSIPATISETQLNISDLQIDYSIFYDSLVATKMNNADAALRKANSHEELKEVVVTSRVSPTQRINNKYTRGMFQNSNMARLVDLVNSPPLMSGINILDYLQGRIPGLFISKLGTSYVLTSQRRTSMFYQPPIRIYLDEQETSSDFVTGIRLQDIALVKYFPPGASSLPNIGSSGVLAIYTKKGEDQISTSRLSQKFFYPGYTVFRDFADENGNTAVDLKSSTIYWNPRIFVDDFNNAFKLQFTRKSQAKRLQVVIEGFTNDGRLLHMEKLFETE